MINSNKNKQKEYKYDVFISHESESSHEFVEQLAKWFEEDNDIQCWYAPRNLDKSGIGRDYDDEIVFAIQNSSCVVVVLNDDALQSRWVKREISQAEKYNKMIFPFATSEITINNGLLMRLEDRHIIAAYPDQESRFPLLLNNVKQLLGQEVSDIKNEKLSSSTAQVKAVNNFDVDFDEGLAFLETNCDRDAFLAFLRAAENGNDKAADYLVEIAQKNNKNTQFLDDDTWERIEALSDDGKSYADLLMHFKYYAMGTHNEVALKYLKRSMNENVHPIAFLQLGICYGWGLGVRMSDILALHYYKKALEKGCSIACRYIGQLYLYGGESFEKDLDKAEEYLLKGIELKAESCYNMLFNVYMDGGNKENAQQLAQQMIDQNIKGGYTLMGDYFLYSIGRYSEESTEWYKKAVKHKEEGAWGNLALCYYDKGEREEAYRLALKGYSENDSSSFFSLGWMYENDGDIPKAWNYYYQGMLRFGTYTNNLGRLYLDKDYLPDGLNLDELKHHLELSARQPNLESIKYLLRIIMREHGINDSSDDITYDNIKDFPVTYEFVGLGAKSGDTTLQYIYGRLMIEREGEIYNPYVGIEFVESAAFKENVDAVIYALKFYNKNKNSVKLSELSLYVIDNNVRVDSAVEIVVANSDAAEKTKYIKWIFVELCRMNPDKTSKLLKIFHSTLQQEVKDSPDEISVWIESQLRKIKDGSYSHPLYLEECLRSAYLQLEKGKEDKSFQKELIEQIDIENKIENISRLAWYKDSLNLLYPDFSAKNILNGNISSERDLRIFYSTLCSPTTDLLSILKPYEERVYGFLEYSVMPSQSEIVYQNGTKSTETKDFIEANRNLVECYREIAKTYQVKEIEEKNLVIPTFFDCSIRENVYQCALNSLRILIASKEAFGEKWQEIADNINNHEQLLNIAETLVEDEELQFLLIYYVEFAVYKDSLFIENWKLRLACHSKNKAYLAEYINKFIDELDKEKIAHNLQHLTEETVPEKLFRSPDTYNGRGFFVDSMEKMTNGF